MKTYTLFFNAECYFCIACKDFIRRNTKKGVGIDFQNIHSPNTLRVLKEKGIDTSKKETYETIYVLENKKIHSKGNALVYISKHLRFPYNLFYHTSPILPQWVKNKLYHMLKKVKDRKKYRV